MQSTNKGRPESQTDGIVHNVDTINRELATLVGDGLVTFDVPPGCLVVLRGELIKLRMVQPGDCVRVTYAEERGAAVARAVEIQCGQVHSRYMP